MTAPQMWLIAAIVLFILEILTPGFVLANFAVASLAAALAAWFGASTTVQIIVFVIVSIASFLAIRPLLHKTLLKPEESVPTGVDALIGRLVTVTEPIGPTPNLGRIAADGDVWRARTDAPTRIEVGTTVRIRAVESGTVVVEVPI